MDAHELLGVLDRPIAYHRCFVAVAGSVAGAVFLSQLVYWARRVPDGREGWLWKTGREWETETGLRRAEQEASRKKLCALGIVDERLTGIPARLHFRLNANKLASLLSSTNLDAASAKLDCRNAANLDAAKPQTNTGTTHFITQLLPRGGGGDLVFPLLRAEERAAIADMVACLSAMTAQQILDELAGNIRAGTIRKTASTLARELVRRAKADTFRPELGLVVAAERAAKAEATARNAAEATRHDARTPQAAATGLVAAKAAVGLRGTP